MHLDDFSNFQFVELQFTVKMRHTYGEHQEYTDIFMMDDFRKLKTYYHNKTILFIST